MKTLIKAYRNRAFQRYLALAIADKTALPLLVECGTSAAHLQDVHDD